MAQGLVASSASAQRGGGHAADRDGGRRRLAEMDSSALRAANRLRALLREQAHPTPIPTPVPTPTPIPIPNPNPIPIPIPIPNPNPITLTRQAAARLDGAEALNWAH